MEDLMLHRQNLCWMLRQQNLFQGDDRLVSSDWWQVWQEQCVDSFFDNVIASLPSEQKVLGHTYEAYWQALFAVSEQYQILAHNQQIFDDKQTIGELDLLVRNLETNQLEHYELACKFYMFVGEQLENPHHWLGPNTRDSLGIKCARLLNQQLQLCNHPAAEKWLNEQGLSALAIKSRAIVQGRLFLPIDEAYSGYCSGEQEVTQEAIRFSMPHPADIELKASAKQIARWGTLEQLHSQAFQNALWQPLEKLAWLNGNSQTANALEGKAIREFVEEQGRPVMCRMVSSSLIVFWVPDEWLTSARNKLKESV